MTLYIIYTKYHLIAKVDELTSSETETCSFAPPAALTALLALAALAALLGVLSRVLLGLLAT